MILERFRKDGKLYIRCGSTGKEGASHRALFKHCAGEPVCALED